MSNQPYDGSYDGYDTHAAHDVDSLLGRVESERLPVKPRTVELTGDAERLTEAARAGAQEPFVFESPACTHGLDALGRLERADEHRGRFAFGLAHEVEAPMHAVGAVDVRVPGRTEHGLVALGAAAVGMARRIEVVVRLSLDNPPADAVDEERAADDLGRHLVHASRKELRRDAPQKSGSVSFLDVASSR